jgi:hypothetical protein
MFLFLDPTKKLILDKLLSGEEYDDLLRQQEKAKINDPLGLYTVLKNIQDRKCSCGFLCIEIGTIYGDFGTLKPKNVTVPYNEEKSVHLIIKPILVVNNTKSADIPAAGIIDNKNIIFEKDEDCDELKISGNYNSQTSVGVIQPPSQNYNKNTPPARFKQIIVKHQIVQRKFYRKVAIGEEIYSKDVFKQGLNVIIVQRDRQYTKCKIIFFII